MKRQTSIFGVATDALAATTIDLLQAYKFGGAVTVLGVVAQQTDAAATWNVELAGSDVFAAEQSVGVADTPEEFIPDQNQDAHDDTAVTLAVDVSGVGAAASTMDLSVLWDDGR